MNSLVPQNKSRRVQIIADASQEPLTFADVREQLGLAGVQIPAEELKDKTFTILRASQFDSSFQEDTHAYFCVVKPDDSPELYTTVLGGQACVEILDAYAQSENPRPLKVTLRWKEGGKFRGYWFFE